MFLNKVVLLIVFLFCVILLILSLFEKGVNEESMISRLELRRATMLKHCSTKKVSEVQSLRTVHFLRNLPGDLAVCVLKKAGSTSLNHFFTNNLDSTDEAAWFTPPDKETQQHIVESRSSLRAMVIRHPFKRIVSAFNFLFRWGLDDQKLFPCTKTNETKTKTNETRCETQNSALAKKIIGQLRPASNDNLLQFEEFVRFVINHGNEFASLHSFVKEHWYWSTAIHWEPFSSMCTPCTFLPHIILELESLTEELPVLLEWSGLARLYGEFPKLEKENEQVKENIKL